MQTLGLGISDESQQRAIWVGGARRCAGLALRGAADEAGKPRGGLGQSSLDAQAVEGVDVIHPQATPKGTLGGAVALSDPATSAPQDLRPDLPTGSRSSPNGRVASPDGSTWGHSHRAHRKISCRAMMWTPNATVPPVSGSMLTAAASAVAASPVSTVATSASSIRSAGTMPRPGLLEPELVGHPSPGTGTGSPIISARPSVGERTREFTSAVRQPLGDSHRVRCLQDLVGEGGRVVRPRLPCQQADC